MLKPFDIFPGHVFYLGGFSAYQRFIDQKNFYNHIYTDLPMHEMATKLSDLKIGLGESFDGFLQAGGCNYLIYFCDNISDFQELKDKARDWFSFNLQGFFYDLNQDKYLDVFGQYAKKELKAISDSIPADFLLEALTLSASGKIPILFNKEDFEVIGEPSCLFFRFMFEELVSRGKTFEAFSLYHKFGLLDKYLPEIAVLEQIHHDKDYHPEGDGLAHTLECLKYLKSRNLVLAWSVILHDIGKPDSECSNKRKFDNHAQIGGVLAEKVLGRMGYSDEFIQKVVFLVKNHMLPMFIPHMTYQEKNRLAEEPLLKELFQLFKIDILGSHRDMDYYQKIKTSFLREESCV